MKLLSDIGRKARTSWTKGIKGIIERLRRLPRYARIVRTGSRYFGNENGYVYLQKFMPDNDCDIRVGVVGDRVWAYRRIVRKNDFRASGSGVNDYDISQISLDLVRQSIDVAEAIQMQSIFMDWVRSPDGKFQLLEISYGTPDHLIYDVPGHWDRNLTWHEGHMYPSVAVIKDVIDTIGAE